MATDIIAPAAAVDLKQIATDVVARATKAGATAAECVVRDGTEFSTVVRLGDVETLKESGARSIGLRVFIGQRGASTYTSDFSASGIEHLVSGAVELARITSEDPFASLPEQSELGSLPQNLGLYFEDVHSLPSAERIAYARRAEQAALAVDPRLQNSDGGSFGAETNHKVLANSLGFVGAYDSSYCSISATPIAQDANGAMQRDWWYSAARSLHKLESPEAVGKEAARRTLRRLGARKISTTRVPIVFDPMVAASIVGHFFEAADGNAIYRGETFFAGKLGEPIAGANVTVIDDGTMPGGFGTAPFDGEGVSTRRTVVVQNGVLNSYLLNTYTAKKLELKTTGNGAGGRSTRHGNFYLQPGTKTPTAIIAEVKNGFYVTEFLGFGVNLVTGDFSRGASGLWIENGELTYPVEEITVAGNLKEMFKNITAIGNDLEWRSSVASPTFRIDGLTIAGE